MGTEPVEVQIGTETKTFKEFITSTQYLAWYQQKNNDENTCI